MAYDSGIVSFTTKTNKVDLVDASHINAVQTELVTIETILGTNVKGDRADLKTRLNNALDADGSILSGTSFPSPALASQGFYRTDLDVFYIRNTANSEWNAQAASLSNVIFAWVGIDTISTDANQGFGSYNIATSQVGAISAASYHYYMGRRDNGGYTTILPAFKWKKISGVSTLTCHLKIWNDDAGGSTVRLNVNAAALSGTVNISSSTPAWQTAFTVDVSSLTNGNTYDILVDGTSQDATKRTNYLSGIVILGS